MLSTDSSCLQRMEAALNGCHNAFLHGGLNEDTWSHLQGSPLLNLTWCASLKSPYMVFVKCHDNGSSNLLLLFGNMGFSKHHLIITCLCTGREMSSWLSSFILMIQCSQVATHVIVRHSWNTCTNDSNWRILDHLNTFLVLRLLTPCKDYFLANENTLSIY